MINTALTHGHHVSSTHVTTCHNLGEISHQSTFTMAGKLAHASFLLQPLQRFPYMQGAAIAVAMVLLVQEAARLVGAETEREFG